MAKKLVAFLIGAMAIIALSSFIIRWCSDMSISEMMGLEDHLAKDN